MIIVNLSVCDKINDISIAGLCRLSEAPLQCFEECLKNAMSFLQKYNSENILVMGDFNLPNVNWPTNILKPSKCISTPGKEREDLLFNFMDDFFQSPFVLQLTRQNKNVLVLILTNHSGSVHNISVENLFSEAVYSSI